MSIPLVFWLVLSQHVYGGASSSVLPIPFASAADCEIAGAAWDKGGPYGANHICLQQRRSDVEGFTGHRMHYSEEPQ